MGLVDVTGRPNELNPAGPGEGIPSEAFFGRARSEQMQSRMQSVAGSVGLTMRPRDVIINSRRAPCAAAFPPEQRLFDENHPALLKEHLEGNRGPVGRA